MTEKKIKIVIDGEEFEAEYREFKSGRKGYGFGTLKPTTIFTNALNYFGKSVRDTSTKKNMLVFDNLTKCQRQAVPIELAKEIVDYCEIN